MLKRLHPVPQPHSTPEQEALEYVRYNSWVDQFLNLRVWLRCHRLEEQGILKRGPIDNSWVIA